MAKTNEELLFEKLDLILKVLALQIAPDKGLIDRVRILSSVGLDNQLIAEVLSTGRDNVKKLLYESKRKKSTRV